MEKDDTPKYEPTIYNYKCREDSSSRSPTPSPPAIKEEPVLENFSKDVTGNVHYTKSPHDGEHSDNCSEVSDEGYRSLGAVQPTSGNGNSGTCTQGSPTVADCQSKQDILVLFRFSYSRVEKFLVARSRYFAGWDLWAVKTAWVGTPVTRIPCCNSVLAGSRLRMEIREWRKFLGERVLVLFSIVRIV